jgi:hypothetical protein
VTEVTFPDLQLAQESWLVKLFFEELVPHLYAHDHKAKRHLLPTNITQQLPAGAEA